MLPHNKNSFYPRLKSLRTLASSDQKAGEVALAALAMLVKLRYPALTRHMKRPASVIARTPVVEQLAQWLAEMAPLEAAFWLSSTYANLVSEETRKDRALYFTPPNLSARILGNLRRHGVDFAKARVLDPACGGAAFLAPVAEVMRRELRRKGKSARGILEHIAQHIAGWDLDPVLCRLSCAFVWMVLHEEIVAAGFVPRLEVKPGNALHRAGRTKLRYDVVICNPPYKKIPSIDLESLYPQYRFVCTGQPNLYSIFMALAVGLTRPGGATALLTPTSFLSGAYFTPLRKLLLRETCVLQLDLIERRQGVFVGVEQETAVTTLMRKLAPSAAGSSPMVATIGSASPPEYIGSVELTSGEGPWILPRRVEDAPLLELFKVPCETFTSYGYEIRVGAFVPHRDPRATVGRKDTPEQFPLIWSEDVGRDGYFIFDTSKRSSRFIELTNAARKALLRTRAVVLQRATSKDDARRIVSAPINQAFIKRYGGYVGENHVIFLVPTERAIVSVEELSTVLGTHTVDLLFRCISGSASVSVFELTHLPLPNPKVTKAALSRGIGAESAVREGYGLSPVATRGSKFSFGIEHGRAVVV